MNALRLLRGLLVEKGEKPLTQRKLSEHIGIPLDTIRSIESGRLRDGKPSDAVLDKISRQTGAFWNKEKERWESLLPDLVTPPAEPFSFAVYKQYRSQFIRRPANGPDLIGSLNVKMIELFGTVPDSCWWDLYLRYDNFIKTCQRDFHLEKLEGIYWSASASISANLNDKDRSQAIDEFKREYQKRLAKERYQKKGWDLLNL
jgi:hypothetical protein